MGYKISIQEDLCFGCGNCAEACPVTTAGKIKAVSTGDKSLEKPILQIENRSAKLVDEEGCRLCGVCIGVCPPGAIKIEEGKN